jgi:hypothetical protein
MGRMRIVADRTEVYVLMKEALASPSPLFEVLSDERRLETELLSVEELELISLRE